MNSDKNADSTMPKGWILCSSKSNPGRKYYFNRKTGKSSWTKPQDGETSSEKLKKKKGREKEKEQIKNIMDNLLKGHKESPKKNMKRKSDGTCSQSSSNTKEQEEVPNTTQTSAHSNVKKQKLSPTKKPETKPPKTSISPVKRLNTSANSIKHAKPTPPKSKKKNIANARMMRLRAELSSESIEEDLSPHKSPNTSQTDVKPAKVELKSPNESKNSTQSPNDSLQSAPSPSQFFAATKIISSMKAQLQEEYNQKKPKDTFADIEQGICNQVTEYPYMKHPATPPQFSEASKLVSAIKSKLSYKCGKEAPVTFSSASDRLNSFRRSLSSEPMDTAIDRSKDTYRLLHDGMDVDIKETKNVPGLSNVTDRSCNSKDNIVLVVDTNIFIQELDFIKNVMNSKIKGFTEPPILLVPWRVINELDKLKDSNNGNAAICKRARPAMNYLYKALPENDRIKVQPLRDANSHIYPCESPDDEILNCCLQQAERGKSVILLSNDKNLCTKAVANGVQYKRMHELELEPSSEPHAPPDEAMRVQKHIYTLLANILENEMRAKYNDIWLHVVFKPPPWSLAAVLQCLLKHWMAVFSEVFPRIEHLITEVRDSLVRIEKKESKNITQSELSNFKDLCLDVAKHCQIIPEYMELAKKTVVRLRRERASDSEDEAGAEGDRGGNGSERAGNKSESGGNGDEVVIEAFEGVWTVLSSYCAKLATGLNIPHSIEDKLPSDDTLEVLTSKLNLFGNHISALTQAIGGILSENQSESEMDSHIARLEYALKDSLAAIGVDGAPINARSLLVFSTKCRIMLHEAHSKFSQLVELLQICKNSVENVS